MTYIFLLLLRYLACYFFSKNQPKTLTLFYPTHRHTKDKKLVVDVDVPEDLDKLYFALDFEDKYD